MYAGIPPPDQAGTPQDQAPYPRPGLPGIRSPRPGTPWTRHPPRPGTLPWTRPPTRHPPGPGRHPPTSHPRTRKTPTGTRHSPWGAEHVGRYGQRSGGMHPTGMRSCLVTCLVASRFKNYLPPTHVEIKCNKFIISEFYRRLCFHGVTTDNFNCEEHLCNTQHRSPW